MKNFKTQEAFISQITEHVDQLREPLTGKSFQIFGHMGELKYTVHVKRPVGFGASSIVYEVDVDDLYPPVKHMIMKEFYPTIKEGNVMGVRADKENPHHVKFESDNKEDLRRLCRDRKKFIDSYDKHIKIMDIDPVLEDKIVRPYKLESNEDFLFALYDIDNAQSVDKYYNLDLARIIDILKQTADILTYLHRKDIIYMDLKPANILYDYKRNRVKLFDFDAAIILDDLDNTTEFFMPSERSFIPPELRYVSDINKRKEVFITEEIDLYMLGVTFFYLLMDRFPTDIENENMELLEMNLREVLTKKSNAIFLKYDTSMKIVRLLQETLSVHRYISVAQFRDRLDEIQRGIDTSKNEEIAGVLLAAYFIDSNPLFDYINEDENGKYIDVAMVGNLARGKKFFDLIFASVDLVDVELRFNIYNNNPKEAYNMMVKSMPLLKETCRISINGKLIDDNINPKITKKPYALININRDIKKLKSQYIIMIYEEGVNYYDLGVEFFNKFKDEDCKRIILNFTRYARGVETRRSDYVRLYNVDIASAATFRNKDYSEEILDQAYEVHRFYTEAYGGERVDSIDIWEKFISGDLYNLKSSVRAAISMKYKLYRAGSLDAEDVANDYYNKVVNINKDTEDVTLRDLFQNSEHHSWNRFVITLGYKRPSQKEFESYAYSAGNNHVDRANKLHPLIVNTDIIKHKNGEDDELEIITRDIRDFIEKKAETAKKKVQDRIKHTINNTNWHYDEKLTQLLPFWEELANVASRIIDGEAFADNTWTLLRGLIDEKLEEDFVGKEELLNDYNLIKRDIQLIVDTHIDKTFRDSDYMIIDAIPLIKTGHIKTIYKPFVSEDEYLWANIIAAIKFAPRNLYLITEDVEENREKFARIERFMKSKRLQRSMNIELISLEDLDHYPKDHAVLDLTENSHRDARRPEFKQFDYVEYLGSNEWAGSYKAIDYYFNKKSLTVEETFYLNNAEFYNAKAENNMSRLNNYYNKFFDAYLAFPSYQWKEFNNLIKTSRSKYILNLSYPRCEKTSMIEVGDFIFRKDDRLKYPKLTTFLDDLVDEGIVIDYKFPVNPGKLKLHTINDYLTVELGEFISETLKYYYNVFDLRKLYFPLLDENENKNIYYYGMSNNTRFSYKAKHRDAARIAYELNKMMVEMDEDIDYESELRVFNHIDNKDYVKADGDTLEFNYMLGDIAFREFLEKGIALQIYTYFELVLKSVVFDEVKLDVRLKWQAYDDYAPLSEGVENHIDIVCTKEFSTLLISCLQEELKKENIYEINNHAKQFGIDTKPVLISGYSEGIDQSVRRIAKATGVYLIDREMLEENGVVEYLENIAEAKKNWKDITKVGD